MKNIIILAKFSNQIYEINYGKIMIINIRIVFLHQLLSEVELIIMMK